MEFDYATAIDTSTGLMEFRTANAGATLNVNRDARIVKNVIVAKAGEAKGHDMHVESSFLSDALSFAKKKMKGRVPVYMGHRWDPNFYQMGYLHNLRMEGEDSLIADLKVYEAADLSPAGEGMPEWFFSLAEEDASAVNLSMSFKRSAMYQYDKSGNAVDLEFDYYNWTWKTIHAGKKFVRFGEWNSTDIVHKGALTDSLFSADGDTEASIAFSQFANSDGFIEWFRHHTERFPQLNEYYAGKNKYSIGKFFNSLFSHNTAKEMDPKSTTPAVAPAVEPPVVIDAAAREENEEIKALGTQLAAMHTQITEMQAQLAAKDTEIQALKAAPAAAPTTVKVTDTSRIEASDSEGRSWERNPINQLARSFKTGATA